MEIGLFVCFSTVYEEHGFICVAKPRRERCNFRYIVCDPPNLDNSCDPWCILQTLCVCPPHRLSLSLEKSRLFIRTPYSLKYWHIARISSSGWQRKQSCTILLARAFAKSLKTRIHKTWDNDRKILIKFKLGKNEYLFFLQTLKSYSQNIEYIE